MRKSFTLLAALVATSFANDARMNALSGSSLFGDAANILYNPAYVTDYKIIEGNITQFGADDEITASGLATWHMSDNLVLGGYYNDAHKSEVAPLFNETFGYATPDRKSVPHLLFGLKLGDNVAIGLDGAYEGSVNSTETDGRLEKERTSVIAARLGANIAAGNLDIDVAAGMALPSSQVSDSKGSSTAADTITADVKGLGINASAYFTINLKEDFRLLAGAAMDFEKVTDKKNDNKGPKGSLIGLVVGAAKDFENDMTLGLEGKFDMINGGATGSDTKVSEKTATFVVAAEKSFGQTKLFDSHAFRIGYGYMFTRESGITDNGLDGTGASIPDTEYKNTGLWTDAMSDSTDVGLTLGTGFTRGKFGLDLFVSNIDFDFSDNQAGILGLMPVAGATLTMDFAKKSTALRSEKKD